MLSSILLAIHGPIFLFKNSRKLTGKYDILENNKFYLIKGKTEKREEKLQFVISDLRKLK